MGGTTSAGGTTASGGSITVGDGGLLAAETASIHCFNWADAGDNFQKGALVLTGLSANDSYDTVLASSNAIISGFKTVLGANTFRIPINETTVNTATTWAAYKGIFDAAISQNVKVIVAYWCRREAIMWPTRPRGTPCGKRSLMRTCPAILSISTSSTSPQDTVRLPSSLSSSNG